MSEKIPISKEAWALDKELAGLIGSSPVARQRIQSALTAAREAGAKEERERWADAMHKETENHGGQIGMATLRAWADRIKRGKI